MAIARIGIIGALVLIGIVGCVESRPPPAATPTADAAGTASLRSYLADNFGDMDWYPLVHGVSLGETTIVVATGLTARDPSAAHAICGAISGWAYSRANPAPGAPSIAVRAADGTVLVIRRSPSERC